MHKNARLTPRGRALMLGRLQSGQHQIDVVQAMGVSLTTVRKWLKRFEAHGSAGLEGRSSRPRRCPRGLKEALREQIRTLRLQQRTGRFICRELKISAASVSRVLRSAGLSRWRDLQPREPERRYERERPGELLHLDIKRLGRITNGKAERFIQTTLREWACAEAYTSSDQRTAALQPWLHHYNGHRPHSGIDSQTPSANSTSKATTC